MFITCTMPKSRQSLLSLKLEVRTANFLLNKVDIQYVTFSKVPHLCQILAKSKIPWVSKNSLSVDVCLFPLSTLYAACLDTFL